MDTGVKVADTLSNSSHAIYAIESSDSIGVFRSIDVLNRDRFAGDQIVANSTEHIRELQVPPRSSTGLILGLIFLQHHETKPTQNNTIP
jgi:hypothetical protein